MWSEFFKRWLEMVSWWFPTSRDEDSTEDRSAFRRERPHESPGRPQATRSTPREPGASASGSPATPPSPTTAPSPSEAGAAAPSEAKPDDDLTAIKGIGAATQDKLHDQGIRTFRDLAGADSETLTEKLKATQMVISHNRVQQWIDAARQRAG
ncbi:MAG TPA: helix-hairpin-helix domain-containing protein [Gammaproteobacteria bacterium]|nr:helix-hairpin-helix domain-containing protein [Gammaproteobacteria bacterium]